MADKQLIWLDYRVLLVTLIVVLAYAVTSVFGGRGKYRRELARSVIWGSGLSIFLILITGIAAMLDFDGLFLQFHFLAFTNQYWSAQGYMLLLFPGGFWLDATLICAGFMVGFAVILGAPAIIYLKLRSVKQPAA